MSDRLTFTNESEGHSETNLDNSLNFVNEREVNVKESTEARQTVHETESSNNSTSFNTSNPKISQPIRSVYQSKRQF